MSKLNKQLHTKRSAKADYFLSGKLYCAHCGHPMKGTCGRSGGNGEIYRYYTCSNPECSKHNVPKDVLENKTIQAICDNLLHPDAIDALADALVAVQAADAAKPSPERDAIQQELADVRRRVNNIMKAIEEGTATSCLTSRLDELEERERTLSFQLSGMVDKKDLTFTKEQFIFLLQQFLIEPAERTDKYGRRIIDTFVNRIDVSDDSLLIHFNISEETANKNKNASPSDLLKESSTVKRLVHLPHQQPNSSIYILPFYFLLSVRIDIRNNM